MPSEARAIIEQVKKDLPGGGGSSECLVLGDRIKQKQPPDVYTEPFSSLTCLWRGNRIPLEAKYSSVDILSREDISFYASIPLRQF